MSTQHEAPVIQPYGPRSWQSPLAVVLVAAIAEALWLHAAPDRRAAGALVPLIWVHAWAAWQLHLRAAPPAIVAVALALAVRLPLVGTPPLLSDDLFRYLWEGLAASRGVDVFTQAPSTITGIDDALRDRVNHADMGSIYPPLAQGWFQLIAAWGRQPWHAQSAGLAADLVAVAIIGWHRPRGALLYAAHPLASLETVHGAHVDGVAVACTLAACAAWPYARLSTLATAAAASIKALPVLLVPVVWTRGRGGGRALALTIVVVASWVALGPARWAGGALVDSLSAYAAHWSFNGAVYTPLSWVVADPRPWLQAAGVLAVVAAWRHQDLARAWRDIALAFLLLTPTAHPWYALWLLAPAAWLGDRRGVWIATCVPTGYLALLTLDPATGAWSPGTWLWLLTWGPALVALSLPAEPRPSS